MRPGLLIAILIPLNLFNVGNVVAYHYDDEDENPRHDSEGGSGYYGTHYTAGGSCDLVATIGYLDSFPVYSFPPEPNQQREEEQQHERATGFRGNYKPYSYLRSRAPLPPEQCTWEFETNDDCELQFRSHYFERGDIECERQYILIGDEYGQERICGFSKPPHVFTSSGKKLFLAHYRQNGYARSVASRLGGLVRCVRRPYNSMKTVYNNAYQGSGSGAGCETKPTPSCKNFTALDLFPMASGVFDITFNVPPNSVDTVRLSKSVKCINPSIAGCAGITNVCFQSWPVGCNGTGLETVTVVNPIPDGPGVTCVNASTPCPAPGGCDGSGFDTHVGSGNGGSSISVHCPATPNQVCTWTVALCLKRN